MRTLLNLSIFLFIGCTNMPRTSSGSFWQTQKENFKYHNLKEFVLDSTFFAHYKSLQKIYYESQSKFFSSASVYLYSWQDRDKTKSDFTLVKDIGEEGINIYYLILDKEDNILSATKIAGKGKEEYCSRFISKDTLQLTRWLSEAMGDNVIKTKVDSSFTFLSIDKNGKVDVIPPDKK